MYPPAAPFTLSLLLTLIKQYLLAHREILFQPLFQDMLHKFYLQSKSYLKTNYIQTKLSPNKVA